MSGLVLMENAGRGVVDTLFELGISGPVVIACGRGNNAGDGFVIARHLDIRNASAKVLLFVDPRELTGDARANFDILRRTDVPIDVLTDASDLERVPGHVAEADWVLDALLGTGARGEPRPPLDWIIDTLNAADARKMAIDVPSGLDCDTGEAARHTFRADHTCTFVAAKCGFCAPGAEALTGAVHVLDIGAPRKLVGELLTRRQ
jgi:NAD(P)H-hydrate epimerase